MTAAPRRPRVRRPAVAAASLVTVAGAVVAGLAATANAATSTPTRPLLDVATAARYTKAGYLGSWTPALPGIPADLRPTITVSRTGTYRTVQAGIDAAVARGGSARILVGIAPGTYREKVCVPASAPPITVFGTGTTPDATVVVFDNANPTPKASDAVVTACSPRTGQTTVGTVASATFSAYANDFQATNLTFANDYKEGTYDSSNQSAVALAARGDRQVYVGVRVLGNQDTLLAFTPVGATSRQYFTRSYVEGDADYVFGRGTTVFEGVTFKTLTARKKSGAIFAPSTTASTALGFLVLDSTITSDGGTTNTVLLGRSWDESVSNLASYVNGTSPNGQLVIRGTSIDASINKAAPWGASTISRPFCTASCKNSPNRMFEFANTGPGSAG